jgi:hypothetical protein
MQVGQQLCFDLYSTAWLACLLLLCTCLQADCCTCRILAGHVACVWFGERQRID